MKYLVMSDIHGSNYYAKKIPEIFEKENADKLILLGDLYYHGPKNLLPAEYDTMKVCTTLNSMKDKIIAIKGNCDAEVDEMISEFDINDHVVLKIGNKKFYFTHGHKCNIDKMPDEDIDVLVYGHFHTGFIKQKDGKIFANPGSISIPKNETKNSYLIIDDQKIILKDMDMNILEQINI